MQQMVRTLCINSTKHKKYMYEDIINFKREELAWAIDENLWFLVT